MLDIDAIVNKVRHKRSTQIIHKKYICEKCNKTIVKNLPRLHNTVPQCSCGEQMKES